MWDFIMFFATAGALYLAFDNQRRLGVLREQVDAMLGALADRPSSQQATATRSSAAASNAASSFAQEDDAPVADVAQQTAQPTLEPVPPSSMVDVVPPSRAQSIDGGDKAKTGIAPPSPAMPPPTSSGLEELIGARLIVWLGGVALALAAIFLVKYSIESGLLSPLVRIVMSTLFGAGLIVASEVMRVRNDRIAAGLAAAGTLSLYGAMFAAQALYHLISPRAGFVLLSMISVLGMGLSLRHGIMMAWLGVFGAYITPALIGTKDPNAAAFFAYLIGVDAAIIAISAYRAWWPLAVASSFAAGLWTLVWSFFNGTPPMAILSLYIVARWAGYAVVEARTSWLGGSLLKSGSLLKNPLPRSVAVVATFIAIGVAAALPLAGDFSRISFAALGMLMLGALATDAESARAPLGATVGGALLVILFMAWPGDAATAVFSTIWGGTTYLHSTADNFLVFRSGHMFLRQAAPVDTSLFSSILALAVLCCSAGPLLHIRRAKSGVVPWAMLSAASFSIFMLIAYLRLYPVMLGFPWGWALFAVAAIPAATARWLHIKLMGSRDYGATLAPFLLTATTLTTLGLGIALSREWMVVAWALQMPLIAFIGQRLNVWAVQVKVMVLAALVATVLLLNLTSLEDVGLPILNVPLYVYGAPALCFAVTSYIQGETQFTVLAAINRALAAFFAWILISLETLSVTQHGTLSLQWDGWDRLGLGLVWSVLGLTLFEGARRIPTLTAQSGNQIRAGGLALACGGLVLCLLSGFVLDNPFFGSRHLNEDPWSNGLLRQYLLPALGLFVLAARAKKHLHPTAYAGVVLAGLMCTLAFATAEVRFIFHGAERMSTRYPSVEAEWYLYSLVWLGLAGLWLAGGVWRNVAVIRKSALALICVTAGKVFLSDTAALGGLWRVGSFLGLGLALMTAGYVYQRIEKTLRPLAVPPAESGA